MIRDEIIDNIALDYEYMQYVFYDDMFGYDQANVNFPIVFPTVWLQLECTTGLDALADKMRKAEGKLPFFDYSSEYDDIGWYDFYIHLNGFNDHHVDTSIYALTYDNKDAYEIDLSDDEQEYIYNELNKEIDCEKLLKDAANDLEGIAGGKMTILERRI